MEREDLPAFVPEFTQSVDSVRPSRNSNRVNGIRVFKIGGGERIQRPRRVLVYRVVIPYLRSYTTVGELGIIRLIK